MNTIQVEEDFLDDGIKVRVNGQILKDKDGNDRTFKTTFEAAIEGARELDGRSSPNGDGNG
jgi:hypothetical protein